MIRPIAPVDDWSFPGSENLPEEFVVVLLWGGALVMSVLRNWRRALRRIRSHRM